jgi:subtilase family serine protease
LATAVNKAAAMGATVISNSYGGGEFLNETTSQYDGPYNHPGIAITVSSGDNGYGVEFPAASQYVTAVGGTSLYQTGTAGRNATETVWSGAGSGCSAYEPKPSWQKDTGCSNRTVADVSAVADTNTPVWVRYNNSWYWFGGTSVAAPIIGAIYALAGNTESTNTLASYPYSTPTALNDVVSGSNGSCTVTYLCNGGPNYDGPTGLGTPNGTGAFTGAPAPPPTPPGAPTGLTATAGNAQITLSWSAPSGTSLTYNVYRGATSGSETLLTTGVTTVNYADTGLTNGSTYYYQVTAVNSVGEGARSIEVSATPATVPGAPTSLTASSASTKGVTLTWNAPSSNGGSAVTGYSIYRSRSSGTETSYATVSCSAGTCSYNDTNTRSGRTYYYQVAATNAVGTGPLTSQVSARAT